MQWDVNKIDLWFRNGLIAVSAVLMALQFAFGDGNEWLNGAMILVMAGVVGYFTNLLALKMLFQPKQGSVLGWEGLVPKNKHLIAEQFGESVQTQLLSPDIIMGYINERQMVARGTAWLEQWLDARLQDQATRERINTRVISILQERGPELMALLFDFSEERIRAMARNPDLVSDHWPTLREKLGLYLQDENNRKRVAEQLRKSLLETLPQLADLLDDAIDTYLSSGSAMGRVGKQIKQLASVDEKTIEEWLESFVNDERSQERFVGVADILMTRLQEKLDAPETRDLLESRIQEWIAQSSRYAREQLLPKWIASLQDWLSDTGNWQDIDRYVQKALTSGKEKLVVYINSSEGQAWVKDNLQKVVSRLNVSNLVREQVMKLDTDELEKMILDNTGGNLVVIQVLGGVLGLFVGTIQVNVWFAIPVFGITGVVMVLAWLNNRRYERNK